MLNDQDIDKILIHLKQNCNSKSDVNAVDCEINEKYNSDLSCLQKLFCYTDSNDGAQREDTNALKNYIRLCREETRLKTNSELDLFIQDLFIKSVASVDVKSKKDGSKEISKFNMCFTTIGGHKVCRKCCSLSYGFSSNKFNTCSKRYKDTGLQKVSSLNHRKWTDDHVHNYSYAETESLFKLNVVDKDNVIGVGRDENNQNKMFIEKVGL